MSSLSLRRIISRNVRYLVNETKRRNNALIYWNNNRSFASEGNDEKSKNKTTDDKKEESEHKHSESMDAFLKLEVQLRQKRKARQILENKNGSDVGKQEKKKIYKVTTEPEEPNPLECCGNDCANCVWIDYAEMMVEYEEYVKAGKPPQ